MAKATATWQPSYPADDSDLFSSLWVEWQRRRVSTPWVPFRLIRLEARGLDWQAESRYDGQPLWQVGRDWLDHEYKVHGLPPATEIDLPWK